MSKKLQRQLHVCTSNLSFVQFPDINLMQILRWKTERISTRRLLMHVRIANLSHKWMQNLFCISYPICRTGKIKIDPINYFLIYLLKSADLLKLIHPLFRTLDNAWRPESLGITRQVSNLGLRLVFNQIKKLENIFTVIKFNRIFQVKKAKNKFQKLNLTVKWINIY